MFLLEKHGFLRMAVREDSVGYNRKETLEKECHFLKIGGPFFIPFLFLVDTGRFHRFLKKRRVSLFRIEKMGGPFLTQTILELGFVYRLAVREDRRFLQEKLQKMGPPFLVNVLPG